MKKTMQLWCLEYRTYGKENWTLDWDNPPYDRKSDAVSHTNELNSHTGSGEWRSVKFTRVTNEHKKAKP